MSITTHVLDTSLGLPAKGVRATLEQKVDGKWVELATGVTNDDGRIPKLLPDDFVMKAGFYRITFNTADYFAQQKLEPSTAMCRFSFKSSMLNSTIMCHFCSVLSAIPPTGAVNFGWLYAHPAETLSFVNALNKESASP